MQRLAGVTVEQFHAEGGGGQFEFATTHCDAFKAADALLLTREAVIDTAQRQGRPATLLPKPFEDRSASGSHLHFSLHKASCKCGPAALNTKLIAAVFIMDTRSSAWTVAEHVTTSNAYHAARA